MTRTAATRSAARVLLVYSCVTFGLLAYLVLVRALGGREGIQDITNNGEGTPSWVIQASVAIAWLLLGSILVLLSAGAITRENAGTYFAFYFLALLYACLLRERGRYADMADYVQAAFNLHRGEPFHFRYLYPPLWATLLALFVPIGTWAVGLANWFAVYASLVILFVLLYHTLRVYGLSRCMASLAALVALTLNVPVMRGMYYGQVNLLVYDLILLSLLAYPRRLFPSALAMALAVHLKVSPVILVLPFVFAKDWKWIAWFCASALGILLATCLVTGVEPYAWFMANTARMQHWRLPGVQGQPFRNNSLDLYIAATVYLLSLSSIWASVLVPVAKGIVLAGVGAVVYRVTRARTFYRGDRRREVVYNSLPVMLFLMVILSPLVWEHHFAFLILPAILVLTRMRTWGMTLTYASSYALMYFIPTCDFYPFSFHRMLGAFLLCALAFFSARDAGGPGSPWFERANRWTFLGGLPGCVGQAEGPPARPEA